MLVLSLALLYVMSRSHGSTTPFVDSSVRSISTARSLASPILDNSDDDVQILCVRPRPIRNSNSKSIEYIILDDDDVIVTEGDEHATAQHGAPSLNVLGPNSFRPEDPAPLDFVVPIPAAAASSSKIEFETDDFVKSEMRKRLSGMAATVALQPITRTLPSSLSINGASTNLKRAASEWLDQPKLKKQRFDDTRIISHTLPMGVNWTTHDIQIGAINRLVVFNLAQSTGIQELLDLLKAFGTVVELEYIDDSSNCRGNVAFVKFSSKLSCANARVGLRNIVSYLML
jgi:hypothetical protein